MFLSMTGATPRTGTTVAHATRLFTRGLLVSAATASLVQTPIPIPKQVSTRPLCGFSSPVTSTRQSTCPLAPAFTLPSNQHGHISNQQKAGFSSSSAQMDTKSQQDQPQKQGQKQKQKHAHTTTSLTSTDLLDLVANRRSYYTLTPDPDLTTKTIHSILSRALLTVPSAFNSQPVRLILAVGPSHHTLWDNIKSTLVTHLEQNHKSTTTTTAKLSGFRAAHGTILFYTDVEVSSSMKQKFPSYAAQFDPWAEQSSGMHQVVVWAALEAADLGLGANLQHYNPLVDEGVAGLFDVPESWQLRAQLVFGAVGTDADAGAGAARPPEKDKLDVDQTLRVFE